MTTTTTQTETVTETTFHYEGGSKTILLLNLFTMWISYIIYSAIIPFCAIELSDCGLSPSYIGTVTAAYPFGMVISSVLAGYLLPVLGTKKVLLSGIVLAAVSSILFGSVPSIACDLDEDTDKDQSGASLSFFLFLLFRTIEGFAAGAVETSVIFCNSDLFKDNLAQVMAYQELATGFACMVGPLLGGTSYDFLGFFWTFAGFSLLNCVLFFVLLVLFPNNHEEKGDEETLSLLDPEINKKAEFDGNSSTTDIGIMDVMSFPIFISLFVMFIFNLFFTLFLPFLPLYTLDKFGWGAMLSGASVGCCALTYALSSFAVGSTVDKLKFGTGKFKLVFAFGFFLITSAYWLMGPYPVTDFLANEASLLIGISLLGIASAFVAIPTLPDAQLCASKVADDSKEVKSLVSGIWQAAIASASVIAGPLGGILYGLWGFIGINFVSAILSLFMCFVTLVLGIIWTKSDPFEKKIT